MVMKATLARIALVTAAVALAPALEPQVSTTVFLVRHAEKAAEGGSDPLLTEAGQKRAKTLADMLADAGITAIFTSEFHRTQDTAAPLAERLGIKVTVIPAKDSDALVARVRELKPGAGALIVGHSNTIPALATRLTGAKAAEMADSEFDRLYVATVRGTEGDLLLLHYGPR